MSHEPGREAAMTYLCEKCDCAVRETLTHVEWIDEYWCDNCIQNQAEAEHERLTEDFHDGGSTRFPDAERVRMEAARRLK